MDSKNITVIGCLPPIIGISAYTKELTAALSKKISIKFLGFNKIYPEYLYPGEIYSKNSSTLKEHSKLEIRNVLNWHNPIGWIIEAFRIKSPIVHAQWWSWPLAPVYFTILFIAKIRGKKIVLTIHNVKPHERNFIKKYLNMTLLFADCYIVHSEQNKLELQDFVKNKEIHVIPHGLIIPPIKNISRSEARQYLNINDKDKILLHFGHIRDYKGLDVALKALNECKDKKIKLLIAGQCWEDWTKYQDIINQYNLQDRVILHIKLIPEQDIEAIFRASDLVLLPYKYFSAQSGVGALAINFDAPIIVSNTGGLPNYVQNENCVFNINDYKNLAKKIELILSKKDLRNKLISDIIATKNSLCWDNIAVQLMKIYDKI